MKKLSFEDWRQKEKQLEKLKMEILALGSQSVRSAFSNGIRGNADIVLLRNEIRRLEEELGIATTKSIKKHKAGMFSYVILALFVSYAIIALLRGAGVDIPRIWGVF